MNDGALTVLVALAETARGEPLTCGRTYGELLVANQPLLSRLVAGRGETIIITAHDLSAYGRCVAPEQAGPVLRQATHILPADILFLEDTLPGLCTVDGGSLETDAGVKLLAQHGIEREQRVLQGHRINYPWELLTANQHALDRVGASVDPTATIEEGVLMHGPVVIGPSTVVKSGSYLEGPVVIGAECTIGPQAHLRPYTSVADGCVLGKTEVVDCILFPGTVSKHHAYLGHSVLGVDVNVGAMTVTSDYRHDGKQHTTLVHNEKVATKRRKLGAFIGDGCRLGIHTSFYPGRKLWPGLTTKPGEIVQHDRRD